MKKCYLVLGLESSGTRFLTKLLILNGCYGSDRHHQPLDSLNFVGAPDVIVFRRSIPHAMKLPDLVEIRRRLMTAGYTIVPILIFRLPDYVLASQVRNGHIRRVGQGLRNCTDAFREVFPQLSNIPVVISYEALVHCKEYRHRILKYLLGIDSIKDMEVRDGNEQYGSLKYGDIINRREANV